MSADSNEVKIIAKSTVSSTVEENERIYAFEEEVQQYINAGARDRKIAIKWILDAITEIEEEDDPDEYYDMYDVYFGEPIVEKDIEIDVNDTIEKHYELPKGYLKATEV